MTTDDLLLAAPAVLTELGAEFLRRGHECMIADPKSQLSACFLLAMRSLSLLCGMGALMKPNVRDSLDVLTRAYTESRDLLMTFRFDDQGIRNKVHGWFLPNGAWKPEHTRVDTFLARLSGSDAELAKRWKMQSALAPRRRKRQRIRRPWHSHGPRRDKESPRVTRTKCNRRSMTISYQWGPSLLQRPSMLPAGFGSIAMKPGCRTPSP